MVTLDCFTVHCQVDTVLVLPFQASQASKLPLRQVYRKPKLRWGSYYQCKANSRSVKARWSAQTLHTICYTTQLTWRPSYACRNALGRALDRSQYVSRTRHSIVFHTCKRLGQHSLKIPQTDVRRRYGLWQRPLSRLCKKNVCTRHLAFVRTSVCTMA